MCRAKCGVKRHEGYGSSLSDTSFELNFSHADDFSLRLHARAHHVAQQRNPV
jgi:hypothetical protein